MSVCIALTGKRLRVFDDLKNDNSQNEYYLTDIIKWANENSYKTYGYILEDSNEAFGINSRVQLAEAFKIMNERHLNKLMEMG